jgi:hypothetical protein
MSLWLPLIFSFSIQAAHAAVILKAHYKEYRGAGYTDGESHAGSLKKYKTREAASKGQNFLFLMDASGLVTDQLITYQGADDEYYTSVVSGFEGDKVLLRYSLEADISAEADVSGFYLNPSHPTPDGYRSIADFALREIANGVLNESKVILSYRDLYQKRALLTPVGDAELRIANGGKNNLRVPGTPQMPALEVHTSTGGGGFRTPNFDIRVRPYKARFLVNPGSEGNVATIQLKDAATGATLQNLITHAGNESSIKYLETHFIPAQDARVYLEFKKRDAGGWFQIAAIDILELSKPAQNNFYQAKHAFLGDSWFEHPYLVNRLTRRLPRTDCVDKGVGGDTVPRLLARLDRDIAPHHPDYVWIMVGTNDYFAGISASEFRSNLDKLISKITEIGATPILFDASVGPRLYSGRKEWELTERSHEYALTIDAP